MERIIHDLRASGHPGRTERADAFVASAGPGAPAPRVAMIHNPRSYRNKGQPVERVEGLEMRVVQPGTQAELAGALARLGEEGVDLLIINGGDGTVRDVLTMGQAAFGDAWPVLAVLPRGKTNALNLDLGCPADWSLAAAIAAYRQGRRTTRRALTVAAQGGDEPPLVGFFLGAGAFTLGIEAGQDAHRIGFFDSLAVGVTAAWGVLQVLFSTDANRWRRGSAMKLAFAPSGEPMPHSRHGDPARRHIMLATTLARMPMGIQLFGKAQEPIRLVVLDRPRRRIFAALPAILAGWHPRWLAGAGLHHVSAPAFSITLEDPFILDGEHYPGGSYLVGQGPEVEFVTA